VPGGVFSANIREVLPVNQWLYFYTRKGLIMYNIEQMGMITERECEPDYKKVAEVKEKELDLISDLISNLCLFADMVGTHGFRDAHGRNMFHEFLGTLSLDKRNREKQLEELNSRIEKKV